MLLVGEDDDIAGFRQPAIELHDALARRYSELQRARFILIPGMEHALADSPGDGPGPQTASAAAVDRLAVEWFRQHLFG